MRTIIHQPYFLPWLGYFAKFVYSDKIIFLDDVEFSKGFYIDRTKYISNEGKTKWLSLPIGNHTHEKINEIFIKDDLFLENMIKTLYGSYSKCDYFEKEWNAIEHLLIKSFSNNSRLVDINIEIIKSLTSLLKINEPEFVLSSNYNISDDKSERIIQLCSFENCDSILMGDGASLKIHDWKKITSNGIKVFIQNFYGQHPIYKQTRRQRLKFAKGISVVDAIFNIGTENTSELLITPNLKPFKLKTHGK